MLALAGRKLVKVEEILVKKKVQLTSRIFQNKNLERFYHLNFRRGHSGRNFCQNGHLQEGGH